MQGLINVQFAVKRSGGDPGTGQVFVIEANPRASRTVPFVAKATGVPLVKIAARVMCGATLDQLEVDQWPSAANFILFRPRHRSGDQVWAELVERSVLVRNCASWPGLDDCLRITLGTAEENDEFLAALRQVLA